MADLVDRAQAHEERLRQAALTKIRGKGAKVLGREECAECGAPIPPARRAAVPDAETCVDCQGWRERKQR